MPKYFEVEDDVQNICLDCHHIGFTHAEHEIEGQEEAEVVCPKCYSTYYFVISQEELRLMKKIKHLQKGSYENH
jgi:Zn finger protein HypA/HybF involved in hydrogenase expression